MKCLIVIITMAVHATAFAQTTEIQKIDFDLAKTPEARVVTTFNNSVSDAVKMKGPCHYCDTFTYSEHMENASAEIYKPERDQRLQRLVNPTNGAVVVKDNFGKHIDFDLPNGSMLTAKAPEKGKQFSLNYRVFHEQDLVGTYDLSRRIDLFAACGKSRYGISSTLGVNKTGCSAGVTYTRHFPN
jgi:hypothetical protein